MVFKRALISGVSSLVSWSVLLSCTPKVGEEAPPQRQQEFNGTACITSAVDIVELFLEGRAKNSQVIAAWDCFSGALQAFEKYVRGSAEDSYTAEELSTFIATEFIARNPDGSVHEVPKPLQAEMMKLKRLLVGGGTERITRAEIRDVISKFGKFRGLTLAVNPFMKVYLMKWSPELSSEVSPREDVAHFEEANRTLQRVARDFGSIIEANGSSYRLDDMTILLRELSRYMGREWKITATVERFLPLAKKLKKSLSGGREDEILSTEWRVVLGTTLRTYAQYLRYYYFIELQPNVGREQKLTSGAKIVEESISIISELVETKASQDVSRQELNELLAVISEAWTSFRYSEKMVDEVMKLKTLLFGGTKERIAASDFQNARLKVSKIRDLVNDLLPFARVYSGGWEGGKSKDLEAARKEFGRSQDALQEAVKDFGGLLETSSKQAFDAGGLLVFGKELVRLYPDKGAPIGKALVEYFPLFLSLKNMVYADDDALIRKDNWPSLLSFTSKIYMTGLYHRYFVRGKDLRQAGGLRELKTLVDRGLDMAREMIEVNPEHFFPRASLVKLLNEAGRLGLLPDSLPKGVISSVMKPVLGRLLNPPEKRLAGQRPDVLRESSVTRLRSEFAIWSETAIFLSSVFKGSDRATMTAGELRSAIESARGKSQSSEALKTGLMELAAIFETSQPLILDAEGRVFISTKGRLKYNFRTVERHNLIRAVSRLLVASYANESGRIRRYYGVTQNEANQAFRDFKALGVSTGLLDPKSEGFMDSRFLEANMFMPRSDGNKLASFIEIHEISFSIMSGLVMNKKLQWEMTGCPGARQRVIHIECMYGAILRRFPEHVASLPDLVRYRQSLANIDFSRYFANTLKGSGWIPNEARMVTFNDASLQPQLWQYIEHVYARFDANGDGGISANEALKAYPIFEGLLLEVARKDIQAGRIKKSELPAMFTYILKYGKPPSGVWDGLTKWYPWRGSPSKWDVWADRGTLAGVLAFIAGEMHDASLIEAGR